MQLIFYRIPAICAKDLLEQSIDLFLYDLGKKNRIHVTKINYSEVYKYNTEQGNTYFQILVKDLNLVQNNEVMIQIAEENKELLLYIDRFNDRKEKYRPYEQANWHPLQELAKAFKIDNFLVLANLIQADLANDPQDVSVFASTVSECMEKVLRRDSNLSRMICFSYCCFRYMGYKDRSLLYDFLGAILFKDIGLSQIHDQDISEENESYIKHPYYSLFLLKKLPIDLTHTCYTFILDHHESQDGSGFPRQKTGDHFHPLCSVLKTSEKLFLNNSTLNEYIKTMQGLANQSPNAIKINQALVECLRITYSSLL